MNISFGSLKMSYLSGFQEKSPNTKKPKVK